MLCSALVKIPELKKVLFDSLGHVPNLPCIQEFLEKAWKEGFDAEGAGQLGSNVFGTRKWIGTTECLALLRSFSIRAEIVDFVSAPAPDTASGTKKKGPRQQTLSGFVSGSSDPPKQNENTSNPKYKPNKELFDWVVSHFEQQEQLRALTGAPILPVYLQHFGHSRTIVGFERGKNNQVNLLIFDPSVWGKNIPTDIDNGKLQKLRRNLQTFTHKEYQVAFVSEPTNLLTEAERLRAKRISALERVVSN